MEITAPFQTEPIRIDSRLVHLIQLIWNEGYVTCWSRVYEYECMEITFELESFERLVEQVESRNLAGVLDMVQTNLHWDYQDQVFFYVTIRFACNFLQQFCTMFTNAHSPEW